MGLTKTDFTLFADLADIIAADLRVDTRAETNGGDRYIISSADLGDGAVMDNGLFANKLHSFNDANYNKQTGTSYTLTPGDRGKTVSINNAAANLITIDTNANQGIPVESVIIGRQLGVGVTAISAEAGVLLNGVDGGFVELSGAYDSCSLDQQAIDDWVYTGSGEVV